MDQTVNVTWYDGDAQPPKEIQALLGEHKIPDQGSIFIGTKGIMVLPHVDKPILLPADQFKEYPVPANRGKRSLGAICRCLLGQRPDRGEFRLRRAPHGSGAVG